MDSAHASELLPAYVLYALDPAEADQVRSHLAQCAACRAELASLAEVSSRLAVLSPPESPPPGLRTRVLASVEQDLPLPMPAPHWPRPRSDLRSRTSPALKLAAAALAVGLVIGNIGLWFYVSRLRAHVAQQDQIQAILLTAEDPPIALLPPDASSSAHGLYRAEPELGLGLLNYYDLPPPGAAQSYQCWFEFPDGASMPCGQLPLEPDGHGLLLVDLPAGQPVQLRVTLESAGAPRPAGPTILSAALGGAPTP